MRIDNWPMDRIMRLPDWCFGRRWAVGVTTYAEGIGIQFDISEASLPDKFVIWELAIQSVGITLNEMQVSLAIGENLPANDAEFVVLKQIFNDIGDSVPPTRNIFLGANYLFHLNQLRQPVEAGGGKLVGRFNCPIAQEVITQVFVVISSLPREVEDWLISGQAINL